MNEVQEAFSKFLRERKGGPAVDEAKVLDLLAAFEAGTHFGIEQAFSKLRSTNPFSNGATSG